METTASPEDHVIAAIREAISSKCTIGRAPGFDAIQDVTAFRVDRPRRLKRILHAWDAIEVMQPHKSKLITAAGPLRVGYEPFVRGWDELWNIERLPLKEEPLSTEPRIKRKSISVRKVKARKSMAAEPAPGREQAQARDLYNGLALARVVEAVLPSDPRKEALAEAALRRNSGPSTGRKLSSK